MPFRADACNPVVTRSFMPLEQPEVEKQFPGAVTKLDFQRKEKPPTAKLWDVGKTWLFGKDPDGKLWCYNAVMFGAVQRLAYRWEQDLPNAAGRWVYRDMDLKCPGCQSDMAHVDRDADGNVLGYVCEKCAREWPLPFSL